MASTAVDVSVGGRVLRLSNLAKVLYPSGFTKAQVVDYYRRVAPVMLGHLAGRPITLRRFPDGVEGEAFYEKRCPKHRPEWVQTIEVPAKPPQPPLHMCAIDDIAGLMWAANLAALELHVPMARGEDLDRPTQLVLDLDPGPPAGIVECCAVALVLRDVLAADGLEAWPKTSGSKGMQLYVPLNEPGPTQISTKRFARALAERLEREHPRAVVSSMKKELRRGKVLIDWSQNDLRKTTVCVYSLRARPEPTASTPITWAEVEAADPDALRFTAPDVLDRVERLGDLHAPVLERRQTLPAARG